MKTSMQSRGLFSWQWWLLLLLTLVFIGTTARLGFWQLGRAQLRERIDAEQRDSAAKPPLNAEQLRALPATESPLYRRLDVDGAWMDRWTVFLNRPHNGRPGFWVMTPLQLSDGQVLLVQRGWAPRDLVSPDKPPELKPHSSRERVQGNWVEPPSQLMELEQEKPSPTEFRRVRQNLSLNDYQRETGLRIAAVMRQTSDANDGLARDWPAIASKAPMNRGYAFQWFALSVVGALYFVWFQIVRKMRDARSKQA